LFTRSTDHGLPQFPSFPPNCRVFIGNLASERTSPEEIAHIFEKHGRLAEEPTIRKTFGFVQFLEERSARAAIEQEQGTMIGGLRIDLSLADNRPVRGPEDGRERERGGKRDRSRRGHRGDRRERSGSRGRDDSFNPRRRGNDGIRIDHDLPPRWLGPPGEPDMMGRRGGPPPPDSDLPQRRHPIKPPDSLSDVLIVRVDRPSRGYCLSIEEHITGLGLLYEDREVDLMDLPETVRVAAERSAVRHVLVVGGRHEPLESVTLGSRAPATRRIEGQAPTGRGSAARACVQGCRGDGEMGMRTLACSVVASGG
jgi:hypothetical protein